MKKRTILVTNHFTKPNTTFLDEIYDEYKTKKEAYEAGKAEAYMNCKALAIGVLILYLLHRFLGPA